MRIGIYDPYLHVLGGGERYFLTIAEHLSKKHQVDIFWDNDNIKEKAGKILNIDINRTNFLPNIFTVKKSIKNLFKKYKLTRKYNIFFYLSDGSIPFLFGEKNILHFQMPFNLQDQFFLNKIKFLKINKIICNSFYTKKWIDKTFNIKSAVIYPPVDIASFFPDKKENLILSVGRFNQALHSKKQEVLIDFFIKIIKNGLTQWKLVLVGGMIKDDKAYIDNLQKKSRGYPIKILPNAAFKQLKNFYSQAKIYWHAAGFGENLKKYPQRAEHFGIATVESMAAGCVPLVFNAGGQKEIVDDNKNGFLWETFRELEEKTLNLIKNENFRKKIAIKAQSRAQDFSKEKFYQKINEIISRSC